MIDPETIPDSALQCLGGALTELLDDDQWNNIEHCYLLPALEEMELLRAQAVDMATMVQFQWRPGAPAHPWGTEWFIAETVQGERLVLRALPEEYAYDFETADATYLKRNLIRRWAQFPDSQFISAPLT